MEWRNQFFTKHFTKKALGLEIGPSHAPIAAKKDGYNVKTVDHANTADLIKKYKALKIDTSRIEEVDYVWDGKQTLTELIGKPHSFDYIIASHVIEHTTDVLTFLEDCQNLLKPSGKLCLAIPDKRYCFDYFRFPTTAGDALQAYYARNVRHTPGKVFDAVINAAKREDRTAWGSDDTGELQLVNSWAHVNAKFKAARDTKDYVDIHNWLFTPASFKLLIADFQLLGLTKLSYVDELPTQGFEFFAILSPKAPKIKTPRIQLAQDMMQDIKTMLSIDETKLRESMQQTITALEAEITAMKQSKRWRYAEHPARMINGVRRKKHD